MAQIQFRNGTILFVDNLIAMDPSCCCDGPCCDRLVPPGATPAHLPETLTMVLTNTVTCPCIDAVSITLTWNVGNSQYEGTGPGGACALLSETWRLSCTGSNPDTGASGCQHWQLSIAEATACIMDGDPFFALTGCTCNPLHLEFDMAFLGIGCCDGSMGGEGTVHVTIDE